MNGLGYRPDFMRRQSANMHGLAPIHTFAIGTQPVWEAFGSTGATNANATDSSSSDSREH
jgi:hypothetical protein